MIISRCHNASLNVVTNENGAYYECTVCHQPANTKFCLEMDESQKDLEDAVL